MSSQKLYTVEKIIGRSSGFNYLGEPIGFFYKIKWHGYPISEATWEHYYKLQTDLNESDSQMNPGIMAKFDEKYPEDTNSHIKAYYSKNQGTWIFKSFIN